MVWVGEIDESLRSLPGPQTLAQSNDQALHNVPPEFGLDAGDGRHVWMPVKTALSRLGKDLLPAAYLPLLSIKTLTGVAEVVKKNPEPTQYMMNGMSEPPRKSAEAWWRTSRSRAPTEKDYGETSSSAGAWSTASATPSLFEAAVVSQAAENFRQTMEGAWGTTGS